MSAVPWLDKMKSYAGEACPTGHPPTQWIEETFKHTDFGPLHGVTPPACAATLNRCLEECGIKGTRDASAISFAHYGKPSALLPGAIVVFRWANGEHHVSICDHVVDLNSVACFGGNQDHQVKLSVYPREFILAVRWPQT